jgi:glycosyltransferase involved in cell wall biosynthesis
MSKISVLIPAFGEGQNLPKLITELRDTLYCFNKNFEAIIINDGNFDGSFEIIQKLEGEYRWVKGLLSYERRGKTKAIKDGFKVASGDVIVLMDADLQYSPKDIPKLVSTLENADVVNGLRVWRKDNFVRKVESRIYNGLVRLFFNVDFSDSNSGLKVFKRKVLEEFVDQLKDGWHRYMLVLAAKKGYQVMEVPVQHNPRKAGRSKYSSPIKLLKGFLDLLSVRSLILQFNTSS